MSRLRRVAMTGVWSISGQIVGSFSQLLVVPLFLKVWTEHTYEDWIALSALVSVVTYADGGMQQHVINLLTQKATQEKWGEFRVDIVSASLMYVIAVALAATGVGGICLWLTWSGHFHGRALEHDAVVVAAVLGSQVVVQLVAGLVGGLYRAFGRADVSMFLGFVTRLGVLVVTLVILFMSRGALALAVGQLVLCAGLLGITSIDTRRRYPQAALTLRGANLGSAVRLIGPSLGFLLLSLAGGLTIQGTVLVIDALIPAALVQYATTRTVASTVRQVVGLFTNAAWPELTRIDAEGKRAKFALAHRVLVKVTGSLAIPLAITLLLCGVDLYAIWTRGRAQAEPRLLKLLLIDVIALAPWNCSSYVLAATSRVRGLSILMVSGGVAQVLLSILAVKLVGVWGIGVVVLGITVCLNGTLVPRWASEVVGESWTSYVTGIYIPYAAVGVGTGIVTWAADKGLRALVSHPAVTELFDRVSFDHFRINEWQTLTRAAGDGILALACAAAFSWLLLFTTEERGFFRAAVPSILTRRRQNAEVMTANGTPGVGGA